MTDRAVDNMVALLSAIVQLVILIRLSAQYGLWAGVMCMIAIFANALQSAAMKRADAAETEEEAKEETGSENEEE